MVCECNADSVKWVEVGRVVARSLGKKGVATIVPFSSGKGVFFCRNDRGSSLSPGFKVY